MKKILGIFKKSSRKEGHQAQWSTVEQGKLQGLSFYINSSAKGWAGAILRGEYEPRLFAEIEALAADGGGLYDIGAHVGYFSNAWLKLGGARVDCFEPVPGNADAVAGALERNGFAARGRVHRLALGDFDGAGTLMLNAEHLGKTSMAYVREAGGIDAQAGGKVYARAREAPVAVAALDAYAAREKLPPPRALKIDVEGAEAGVLRGAQGLLARHRPAILAEIHNIDTGIACAELLAGLGYRSRVVSKDGGMPVCRWDFAG